MPGPAGSLGVGFGGDGSGSGPGGAGGTGPAGGKAGPAFIAAAPGPGIGFGGGPGTGGTGGAGATGTGTGGPVALISGPVALGGGGGGLGGGLGAGLASLLPPLGEPGGAGPGVGGGLAQGTKGGPGDATGGLYVGVAGSFDMPSGITNSDYDADQQAMPNLLSEIRKRTNVHVTVSQRTVALKLDEIKDTPVLQLRGHKAFSFTPEQREALRQYVAQGGTIMSEDSHGPFGECLRREIRLIFGKPLRDLPLTHEIYRAHYVMKSYPAGDMGERYPLQGVDVGGRLGVVFSRNDYGGCWDGTGGWVKPETREPAFEMGTNVFVYIVAHWNKRK